MYRLVIVFVVLLGMAATTAPAMAHGPARVRVERVRAFGPVVRAPFAVAGFAVRAPFRVARFVAPPYGQRAAFRFGGHHVAPLAFHAYAAPLELRTYTAPLAFNTCGYTAPLGFHSSYTYRAELGVGGGCGALFFR